MLSNQSFSSGNMSRYNYGNRYQQGSILVLSLVLLGVLSLLGLSSLRGALTEEKISINIQDNHLALQGANSAARFAEQQLSFANTQDLAFYDTLYAETPPDLTTWNPSNQGASYNINPALWAMGDFPPPLPQYKLERFALSGNSFEGATAGENTESTAIRSTTYFRVLSRGQGRSPNSSAITESIIIRQ